jgi:hypothetical protein
MVKEANSFAISGHQVIVIYCHLASWATEFDLSIRRKMPDINWQCVNEKTIDSKLFNGLVRLRRTIWHKVYYIFGDILGSSAKSSVLYSQDLIKHAIKFKADLYIGHNLGALPAVIKASKLHNAKSSFDFEDFHRGESFTGDKQSHKVKLLEDKFVPFLDYATYASPLIEHEYKKFYPRLNSCTINNYFPLKYRNQNDEFIHSSNDVKLFWFSQFIGKDRGLEDILRAIGLVNDHRLKLSLLGNVEENLKAYFKEIAFQANLKDCQLIFLEPVQESDLVQIGQIHHIGLASEVLLQENRNYCLTNKIFIYLLSKNAILFSNTKAQSEFLREHPGVGMIYNQGNIQEIAEKLIFYLNNPVELENHRKNSERLGERLNWENESIKLLQFYNLD